MRQTRRTFLTTGALGATTAAILPTRSNAASGISALVQVAHLKAQAASEEAQSAAERQRDQVGKGQDLRDRQNAYNSAVRALKEIEGILAKVQVEMAKAGCL